jgi:hypothetical protein
MSGNVYSLQVCLHIAKRGQKGETGQCVRATAKYVPSYSTKFEWVACTGSGCKAGFKVSDSQTADAFEKKYNLSLDPMWTETYNDPILVTVMLEEPASTDNAVLASGLVSTAVAIGATIIGRMFYQKHKPAGYQ